LSRFLLNQADVYLARERNERIMIRKTAVGHGTPYPCPEARFHAPCPPPSVSLSPPPPSSLIHSFPHRFFSKRKQREKQTHPKCPLTRPDHKESPLHPHVSFVSLADHVVIPHEERLNDRLLAYHLPTTLPSPPPLPGVIVIIE